MGLSLLLLLGQICCLRTCLLPLGPARHVGGGVVPPSLVEITWISKQYQVSGRSGICLFTRDWDGEWDGALLDASISLGPLWQFSGVWVWPSIWTITPDFWSSWSLVQVVIKAEMLTISGNYQKSLFSSGARAHAKKWRNDRACASHI